MNASDLRLTILGCFRYSLGRMTYMPSHTFQIIKENSHLFRKHDWDSFIKEIDECDNLGMACDKRTWNKLKEFSQDKLNSDKEHNTKSEKNK